MICPNCQSDNPELNRFCGMCGTRLNEPASAPATPASDQPAPNAAEHEESPTNGSVRRPFIISQTTADMNSQITRVAVPRTIGSATHSSYVPAMPLNLRSEVEDIAHGEYLPRTEPAPVDPQDEPLFSKNTQPAPDSIHVVKTAEKGDYVSWVREEEKGRDSLRPSSSGDTPVSGSILGLTAPVREAAQEPAPYVEEPAVTYPIGDEEERAAQASSESFLRFDEPEKYIGRDVSGPSFLGLGSNDNPEYLLEDAQTPSHARGYLLLFVLAVVAVLGVLEWRASSRGESTNPMDVLHIKLPKRKGQGEAVVVQPNANSPATTTAGNNVAANNNGKPELIAEPNQPAVQPTTPPQPATDTPSPAASTSTSESSADASTVTGLNDGVPANSAAKPATPSATPVTKHATTAAADREAAPPATTAPDNPPVRPAARQAATAVTKPAPAVPSTSKPVTTASVSKKPEASRRSASSEEIEPTTAAAASLSAGNFELQKGKAAGATAEGRTWLWRAMSKGNGEAPVLLADMYAQGRGVTKDCEQAVLLLKAAAKKPNPAARSKLGSMYATGECLPKDRVEAYRWMHGALQVNPGSEWLEKNQETLWKEMSASERQRASTYR